MRIIGITGGVGSGKTKILERLKASQNCKVINADGIANLLKEPGQVCHQQIIDLFGQSILDGEGQIDKAKMAQLIFNDAELLKKVNHIIHPAVKEYIINEINNEKEKAEIDLLFIEAALLIEDGYDKIVDELWYVYADEATRLNRLIENRGYTIEKAKAIIAKQLSDEEFRTKCQVVIDNNGQEVDNAITQIETYLNKEQ
jgi:dephospho-CoA kinase